MGIPWVRMNHWVQGFVRDEGPEPLSTGCTHPLDTATHSHESSPRGRAAPLTAALALTWEKLPSCFMFSCD